MTIPHPIRRIRKTISDVQETVLRFAQFLAVIYDAIQANTAAVQENTQFLKAQYWAAVEQAKRQTSSPTPTQSLEVIQ